MQIGVSITIAVALLAAAGVASAACPPGKTQGCVNLDLTPKVSQDIVGGEGLSIRPKVAPASAEKAPYTGPTVGFSDRLRRAPEIGYKWSLD
jgi:hypothetical protein